MNLADLRGLIESILVIIGIYSFTFQKSFFPSKNWFIIFWYLVVVWSLDLIYYSLGINFGPLEAIFKLTIVSGGTTEMILAVAFSILLSLPGLFAIYKLSSKK